MVYDVMHLLRFQFNMYKGMHSDNYTSITFYDDAVE
jgi:hypothetical protein